MCAPHVRHPRSEYEPVPPAQCVGVNPSYLRKSLSPPRGTQVSDLRAYVVNVVLAQLRMQRERQQSVCDPLGDRKAVNLVAEQLAEVPEAVHRDEVNRGADPASTQFHGQLVAAASVLRSHPDHVQMPRMPSVGGLRCDRDPGHRTQLRGIPFGRLGPAYLPAVRYGSCPSPIAACRSVKFAFMPSEST